MTRQLAPAKTANVAIARVLRSLGLKQGQDFRVNGKAARGTYVTLISYEGHQAAADNARAIVNDVADAGFPFDVDVHIFPTGTVRAYIRNSAVPVDALNGRVLANGVPVEPVVPADVDRWDGVEGPVAFLARVNKAWPAGTRVQGVDSHGVPRTGVCLGVDTHYVTDPGHPNYRRSYTGVWWLNESGGRLMGGRSRPFTDELVRI
jgi:hypothetical protein